ncbi:putative Insertion element IS1016 transposase domain protein [Glaesserella parasuis SW114]|nr:putative Insertion element IS1016 transposase domain protein [Glaesserella parasuis SW114]
MKLRISLRRVRLCNGIESFWNQAKRHLRKFKGIPKAHFELFIEGM